MEFTTAFAEEYVSVTVSDNSDLAEFREGFNGKIQQLLSKKRPDNNFLFTRERYDRLVQTVKGAKARRKKEPPDYKRLARYDVVLVGGREMLIKPIADNDSKLTYFVTIEELFDVVHNSHLSTDHGGRDKMSDDIKNKYCNITKEAIMVYLSMCDKCQKRKSCQFKAVSACKPALSNLFGSRGQVDVVGMPPCREYNFVMVYRDCPTQFVMLKPLKTKGSEEVADRLLDMFMTVGAPVVLQSDEGREFSGAVVKHMCSAWRELRMVHGNPRRALPESGAAVNIAVDVRNVLLAWMGDNNTGDWASGLTFVQFTKNRMYHEAIERTPFEAMFGCKAKIGLASLSLPEKVIQNLKTEEDLEKLMAVVYESNSDDVDTNGEVSPANESIPANDDCLHDLP